MRRVFSFSLLLAVTLGPTCPAFPQRTLSAASLDELQAQAQAGDPAAESELAFRYRTGQGVARDLEKSVEWYRRAAKLGYAQAYFNLGTAYYNGDGLPVDDAVACRWFLLAAEAGDAGAHDALERTRREIPQEALARCEMGAANAYADGTEIKPDYPRAIAAYRALADRGNGEAAGKLAMLYALGLGAPKDLVESTQWLQRSARTNYPPACLFLGDAYDKGIGVAPDPALALLNYQRAAAAGIPRAMLELGRMYAEGRGTTPDKRKAYMWYLLALRHDQQAAQAKLDALAAEIGKKGVTQAAAKADQWRAQVFLPAPAKAAK